MMFIVTALDTTQRAEDFAFQLITFEEGLDFISNLVANGEVLLRVALVDTHSLVLLPVMAFDGAKLSAPIQQLEAEWKAILGSPATEQPTPDSWWDQWLERCERRMAHQVELITSVRRLLDQLQRLPIHESLKQGVTQRYHSVLARYERQLARTYSLRKRLQQRRGK